jgi:hypothetical protein
MLRFLTRSHPFKELPYLNGNIGPRRGMSTREDLLRLTLQEGCWYNLRSRKALEDSKGHTTKSPLATNKTAAWRHAWLQLWRSGSCVIDSVELRRGRDPEGMGRMVIRTREPRERERECSDSGIDSEELSPSLQFRHGVCAVAG